jgi:hypothetical protein
VGNPDAFQRSPLAFFAECFLTACLQKVA